MQVMLHPSRPGRFIREVLNRKGEVAEILEFEKNEPKELKDAQCRAVADDIGVALVLVNVEKAKDGGASRVTVDWDGTEEIVKGIAEAKKKAYDDPKKPGVRELLHHQKKALGLPVSDFVPNGGTEDESSGTSAEAERANA